MTAPECEACRSGAQILLRDILAPLREVDAFVKGGLPFNPPPPKESNISLLDGAESPLVTKKSSSKRVLRCAAKQARTDAEIPPTTPKPQTGTRNPHIKSGVNDDGESATGAA